jgi:hypothetical protein
MAEAALYDNLNEAQFPFQATVDPFKWLPAYIESVTPKRGRHVGQAQHFEALMNTLLVLTGARTSALLTNCVFEPCVDFVIRLNRTLDSIPKDLGATHHQLELVPRKSGLFFVTCKRSPRFNWSRDLTDYEVGLNLDFCGASHFGKSDVKNRLNVQVFEIHQASSVCLTVEAVYLDQISDAQPIYEFFNKRTALWNRSMHQLGMPYRFAHFMRANTEDVARVMQSPTPPSPKWWATHYPFIGRTPYQTTYVSADSHFSTHWSFLRAIYNKLATNDFKYPLAMEYAEETENLFKSLYSFFRSDNTSPDACHAQDSPPALSNADFEGKVMAQLSSIDLYRPVSCNEDYPLMIRSGFKCVLSALMEMLRMRTTERWKLREPLVYNPDMGVDGWNDYGHEQFCDDPLRVEFRQMIFKSFWYDEFRRDCVTKVSEVGTSLTPTTYVSPYKDQKCVIL